MIETKLQTFLPAIQSLDITKPLTKQDLLTDAFSIASENELSMYYSPHNEFINDQAKLIIVGITPGWHQMKVAFEQIKQYLAFKRNLSLDHILVETKKAASFSGTMRKNLIDMLDQIRISQVLHIPDAASLFDVNRDLIHTTSVIKYPVFFQNKNYTGHKPKVQQSPLLTTYAYGNFVDELNQIKSSALVIPLGRMVEEILQHILKSRNLTKHIYLFGFPHPSGANGHRIRQFNQNKPIFSSIIHKWERNF
ncbi:hypothetical protein [Metabacillus halosaccharovorans]|uniref:Uracil-DNA glycosylase-like domain-containing protein n=1 Tax=Metabacillus halosaccharovorans TaxID=930124 RepID=A0ABT3DB68_9BACI|nr:hypothetical protein [Metabacillus halosaccharovorans]MCV9884177.1 hypothetical protein [Metabacillus halosaccharovorans]